MGPLCCLSECCRFSANVRLLDTALGRGVWVLRLGAHVMVCHALPEDCSQCLVIVCCCHTMVIVAVFDRQVCHTSAKQSG